ncbi:MAG: hypothetical protein R2878_02135 [Thermoleophilia bacterium]
MATRRLELGFTGGGVTQVTINEEAVAVLTSTLGSGSGWTEITGVEDSTWVNLDALVYVRVPPPGAGRVGFGGD